MLNSDGSSFAAPSKTPSTTNERSAQITNLDPARDHEAKHKLDINFRYLEDLARLGQREQRGFPGLAAGLPLSCDLQDPDIATAAADLVVVPLEEEPLTTQEGSAQACPDPNRFSFFSSALECTIHVSRFGDLVLPGDNISTLFNLQEDESAEGVWWLNVNNPSREEIRAICLAFGIHPLTMEDIDTKETREKIELFPSYYFASFRSFKVLQQPGSVKYAPFNVYVVVFREGTISFSFTPNNHASQVRSRIAMLKEHVSISSDWICYALIDDIVDTFAPELARIERETATIEDQMYITRPDDHQEFLLQINKARKGVLSLMRLLGGKADVLRAFTKRIYSNHKLELEQEDSDDSHEPDLVSPGTTPDMHIGLYLGDVQDHITTTTHTLTHLETILSSSRTNYLTRLSIEGIEQGTQTNRVLGRLNVIATLFLPLTVLCSLFGMNVRVPWQEVEDNVYAFVGIAAVIAVVVFGGVGVAGVRWRR
ncbi:hypothetical protein C8A01DRAFT_13443 [Parachaetomium inaequale]|uniref:Magnesium transporter CorA n=1 Tax=Parachaetomium inaequale TaxID=2588326 RepID=A0AAN6PLE9_9PEZI|nr:hypothetical protein C8A01DRAFT_13443 [Parachaetomium inaequale]